MAITEESRHDLYLRLEAALGQEEATTLMGAPSPVGWADVATKYDLAMQSALFRNDFDALRGEFEAHRVATKQDIDSLRTSTKREFGVLQTEIENSELRLRTEIGQLRVDLGEKFNRLLFQLLASMAGLISLVLLLSRKG